jgi:arginyl-tRNA synthetase
MWSIFDFANALKNICPQAKIEVPPDNIPYHVSSNILMLNPEINLDSLKLPYILGLEKINNFVNFKIDKNVIKDTRKIKEYKKINLEFCSPNPTGPMHLAHCRGTVIGAILVNLLRYVGYDVLSEMYINDQGVQVDKFVESVKFWKFGEPYQLHYKGEYVKELASLKEIDKDSVIETQLITIRNTLKKMNVMHDVVVRESSLHDLVEKVKQILQGKGLFYEGYLENQKKEGKNLILKTSQLGYESDTIFQREDGSYTYFAFDVAYHFNKQQRGYNNQICVLGEDHFSHMNKLPKVLNLFGINLGFVTFSAVHLVEKGEKLSMSKRDGKFITIDSFLEKYSIDEIKCMVLEQKLEKTLQFSSEKTASNFFYFQYASERLRDITENTDSVDLNVLDHPLEERIFSYLIHFDRFVHIATSQMNVHKFFDFSLKFVKSVCEYFQKHPTINSSPSKEQVNLLYQCKQTLSDIILILQFDSL